MTNQDKITDAYQAGLQIGAVLNDMYLISKGVRNYCNHYIDFECHDLLEKEVLQYLAGLNNLAAGSRKIKYKAAVVCPLFNQTDFKSIYFECWSDDKEKETIDLLRKESQAVSAQIKHTCMGQALGYEPRLVDDFVRATE